MPIGETRRESRWVQQRLASTGRDAPVGRCGECHEVALAEVEIGLFNTATIRHPEGWRPHEGVVEALRYSTASGGSRQHVA